MRRTLTITFEFEDGQTDGIESKGPSKPLRKALEIASCAFGVEGFTHAKLDGNLLMDKDGNAPDEVMLLPEYARYLCFYR